MAGQRILSESIVIDAPARRIFDLLADPRRHRLIDGSGTLRGSVVGPDRLDRGSKFGMSMRMVLPYRVTNTVVEFDEGRRIAWQHMARHTWRYELEARGESTQVTESWDWSASPVAVPMEIAGFPARNRSGIRASLRRLKQVVESGADLGGSPPRCGPAS